MTSTYTLPDQMYNDFALTTKMLGLNPTKTIRRLIAYLIDNPQNMKINNPEFLQKIYQKYGAKGL